jgi:hypothetical protein
LPYRLSLNAQSIYADCFDIAQNESAMCRSTGFMGQGAPKVQYVV